MAEQQRVMLWNPWQAGGPDFWSHGKPVNVPAGWRVLGMVDKNVLLVSVDKDNPAPQDGDRIGVLYMFDASQPEPNPVSARKIAAQEK